MIVKLLKALMLKPMVWKCQMMVREKKLIRLLLVIMISLSSPIFAEETATLSIRCNTKAKVVLNGITKGTTPLIVTVKSDTEIEVILFAAGFKDHAAIYKLKSGESRTEVMEMEPEQGEMRILSDPEGAEIIVDGQQLLDSTFNLLKTPATIKADFGKHTLVLKLKGFQDIERKIEIIKKDNGTKQYTLLKPARVTVRIVPEDFLKADIFLDNESMGSMNGLERRSFALTAGIEHTIVAKYGTFESELIKFRLDSGENRELELSGFKQEEKKVEDTDAGLEKEDEVPTEGFFSRNIWHITTLSVVLVSRFIAKSESDKYDELATQNDELENRFYYNSTSEEKTVIRAEFDANLEEMKDAEDSCEFWNLVSLIALGYEAYLLLSGTQTKEGIPDQTTENRWVSRLRIVPGNNTQKVSVFMQWRW